MLLTFGARGFFVVGTALHCGMVGSTPGFSTLDASGNPPQVLTTKNVFRYRRMSPGGRNCPGLRPSSPVKSNDDSDFAFTVKISVKAENVVGVCYFLLDFSF